MYISPGYGETVEVAEVEDTSKMLLMRFQGVGENQDIIEIDETKWKPNKYPVYHPLESLGGVPEAKGKAKKLEDAKWSDNGLGNVGGSPGNLEKTFLEIEFGE